MGPKPSTKSLVEAVGDPFQPFATGLLIGAREAGQAILLGGGGQMLAVLALALSTIEPSKRHGFVEKISLGTTSWLVEEGKSSLDFSSPFISLMNQIGEHFDFVVSAIHF